MMKIYALIHKDPDSDYGVSFPDFPGCITAGSTMDEAYQMAMEALAAHVAFMRDDGDPIPEPSALEAVRRHEDARDAETILGVPLGVEEPAIRINISLPANELRAIDSAAERQGMTRSGFLVHAARGAMRARGIDIGITRGAKKSPARVLNHSFSTPGEEPRQKRRKKKA